MQFWIDIESLHLETHQIWYNICRLIIIITLFVCNVHTTIKSKYINRVELSCIIGTLCIPTSKRYKII